MGMVFRKTYTMPAPPGAELVERNGKQIARWRLRNGTVRTAEVADCRDGKIRVHGQSKYFIARYRNANGRVVDVPTRCRDPIAARALLTKLEREAELIRSGVLTPAEADAGAHADLPFKKHVDAYAKHLRAKGCETRRIGMVRRRLERLGRECRFGRLNTMLAERVERWLVEQQEAGLGAATRNTYRESLVGFGNWCRRTGRLTHNPFADLPRADANTDRRHQRRALTEDELLRLLKVARLRPLAEYGRVRVPNKTTPRSKRSRATWKRQELTYADLDDAVARGREALQESAGLVPELQRRGWERALIYRTLALTGLRKGELASITVGQLELDGDVPYIVLHPADEKNRRGSDIPLRPDLAEVLQQWCDEKLARVQDEARGAGEPIPARLPANTQLFDMPSGLTRIFDHDLATAGIPKRDERNRVVDIHALRVTFGTHLAAAGVPLRTAQAAMRHSKPELTANVYTDPRLLDIAGAIASLPAFVPDAEAAPDAAVVAE